MFVRDCGFAFSCGIKKIADQAKKCLLIFDVMRQVLRLSYWRLYISENDLLPFWCENNVCMYSLCTWPRRHSKVPRILSLTGGDVLGWDYLHVDLTTIMCVWLNSYYHALTFVYFLTQEVPKIFPPFFHSLILLHDADYNYDNSMWCVLDTMFKMQG